MSLSAPAADRMESLYALAIRLYPPAFRERFAASMRRAFRDALEDRSLDRHSLIPLVVRDLATSLAKEHFSMLRDIFARPALIFNALILSALASGLALALYSIPQQVLRQGANDPQIAMADDLAAKLEQGTAPAEAVPTASIDMARSLSPFVIVYDDQGRPVASQGKLDGQMPAPPQGVFDFVRLHGQDRLSWQPVLGKERGVRIAAVVEKFRSGNVSGFVLAGRNMREVEARESQVSQMAGATWIGMMGVILIGTAAFGWYTRPRTQLASHHAPAN